MAESDHLLLLDPSIFLGEEGFDWLVTSPDIDRSQFVVPRNFFDQVGRRAEYRQSDQELWGPLPDGQSRRDLEELLAGFRMFAEQDAAGDLPLEAVDVLRRLRDLGSQTAIEEWLFLQTNSWLAARTRTVLDQFRRAGARAAEMVGSVVDDLVWLAVGRRPPTTPETLTPELKIRAGINVVVVGGIAALGLIGSWLAVPAAIVAYLIQPYLQQKPSPTAPPPALPPSPNLGSERRSAGA